MPLRSESAVSAGERLVRDRLPHTEAGCALEPLPEPRCAEPAVLVVHARHAARVRDLQPARMASRYSSAGTER